MAQRIPNLWSQKDVNVQVLSPLAILRTQAANLEQMTKGLIEAEVTVLTDEKGETVYQLDIIAPVLGGYRHRLLAVSHQKDMVYPVKFILSPNQSSELLWSYSNRGAAETELTFLEKLGEVLQSKTVNAVIQSIIARSNEILAVSSEAEAAVEAAA